MTKKSPDLHDAYSLSTPEDSKKLYANWAADYDSGFIASTDYQLHHHTAAAFVEAGGQGPVLDVGAGTGVCGVALAALGIADIDATDISREMLDQAMAKGVYRTAIEADLTLGPPAPAHTYRGIVSSGTFTTGHVGPDTFDHLLVTARPGALFAISINCKHYAGAGFEAKFAGLGNTISDLVLNDVAIYGPAATGPNKDDRAFVAVFRKT